MRAAVGLVVALMSCAQAHFAEPPSGSVDVSVGSRVRVTSGAAAEPTIGTVAGLEGDALVVRGYVSDTPMRIPIADIQRLEVSAGRMSHAGRGALIGAAVGAMSGVLVTIGDYSDDVHGGDPNPAATAAIGAAGGALVGAAIGWRLKTDRWLPGELPKAGVSFVPLRRGAALSFRMTWTNGSRGNTKARAGPPNNRMQEPAPRQ